MVDLIGDLMAYGIFKALWLIWWLIYCFIINLIGNLISYG